MRTHLIVGLVLAANFLAIPPIWGHHAFAAVIQYWYLHNAPAAHPLSF